MAKLQTLEQIRENIRGKVFVDNLVKQSNGNKQKLFNAMAIVPETKIWNLVQWMHEVILPKIAVARGEDSVEFGNYTAIRDALIMAMYISGAYERQLLQHGHLQLENQLLRERVVIAERELQRFTTVEELAIKDGIQVYQDSLIQRALNMLSDDSQQLLKTK